MSENTWPWPRTIHAKVIDRLFQDGAKNVAVDIALPSAREGDAELVAVLKKYPGRVVLVIAATLASGFGLTHFTFRYGVYFPVAPCCERCDEDARCVARLNARWQGREDRITISIGIGINHGSVITGEVGFLRVKGKTKPVHIFSPISEKTTPAPEWLADYEKALALHRSRDFAGAAAVFTNVNERCGGDDFLCGWYLDLGRKYLIEPPREDWGGSETLAEK